MSLRNKMIRTAAEMPKGEARTALLRVLAASSPRQELQKNQRRVGDLIKSIQKHLNNEAKNISAALAADDEDYAWELSDLLADSVDALESVVRKNF